MAAETFTWGNAGEKLTPTERRRRMAEAMIARGTDASPIKHWLQGASRVAEALMGQWELNKLDAAEKAAQTQVAADAAAMGMPGAAASAPSPATVASNNVQPGSGDPQNALDAIMNFESGGRNVHQNVVPAGGGFNPSTGTVTGPSSASGYFQMIDPTWRSAAKLAGVDTSQYPTAMSAPYEAQRKVAAALYAKEGFAPWAPYNAALRAHIAKRGGAGAFINDGAPAQVADLPAAGAAPVSMESGQPGFVVPPAAQPAGTTMSAQLFNAIHGNETVPPAFQSEGIRQPWMGTAVPPQPPAGPTMVAAPLPPSRPTDLAMPQADLPAPGAVPTIGQFAPQPQEDLSNAPGAGAREGIVRALMAQQGQTPPVPTAGQAAHAEPARAPSPAVQQVAQAAAASRAPPVPAAATAAAQPSPGVDRVASAIRVMNSPYAQPGQKAVAQMILQQAYRDPTDTEMKRLQLEKAKRDAESAPLERESKQLDIDTKKKALGKVDAPTTKVVKQADGSEVALQWDGATGEWVPLKAPQGGNAVGSNPTNPYALPGKPSEAQAKDAGFAGRMVESHNQITSLESVGTDRRQAAAGAVPYIGNQLSSPDKQRFEQAKRNFVTAVLRKESGAAISTGEFETEEKKYFPQIGDSPEVIRQKRDARELAIEGVMAGAGNGYKVPDSYKPQRGKAALPSGQTKSGVKWSVE